MRCRACGQDNPLESDICKACGSTLAAAVEPIPVIGVFSSYGHAWRQLWKHFLMLFLVGIIYTLISLPSHAMSNPDFREFLLQQVGVAGVASIAILWTVYGILFVGPIGYSVKYIYLRAARNDPLNMKDLFEAFYNYWNAVFASLLVGVIVGIGFVFLIIPGIIFACKLAFTPYLVVDRRMKVIDAVQESWRMTRGHSWKVFLIGLSSIPLFIAGLSCCFVGVIVAIMWNKLAFATLYHAVSSSGSEFVQEGRPMAH